MNHHGRFLWFDFIRGLSALLVCATHLRAAMFVNFSDVKVPSFFTKIFYFATGLGHQAVIIFFVLSGFFVGGLVIKKQKKFSFNEYIFARLVRLWVVLVPMLLLTFIVDQFIFNHLPVLFSGEHLLILNSGPTEQYSLSLITFIGNVFFLQTLATPVFGSNGPLWSLANEFWYYILFPLLMIVFGRIPAKLTTRIMLACLSLLIIYFFSNNMLEGFIVWLIGALVYVYYERFNFKITMRLRIAAGGLFLVSLVDSKVHFIDNLWLLSSDLFIAICFALFLITIKETSTVSYFNRIFSVVARWLSDISFTLYLCHFPLILLIYSNIYAHGQLNLELFSLGEYVFWFVILVFISHLLWCLFEKHTLNIRSYLSTYFFKGDEKLGK
jgi:peptidoglycan/LPS O-acetylase OafA/YrhL